jgi:hypothetical protein
MRSSSGYAFEWVRGGQSVLESRDVQDAAVSIHLGQPQPAGFRRAQPVLEHQQQQTVVARLVAGAFDGR